jgi:hypothetical protein
MSQKIQSNEAKVTFPIAMQRDLRQQFFTSVSPKLSPISDAMFSFQIVQPRHFHQHYCSDL